MVPKTYTVLFQSGIINLGPSIMAMFLRNMKYSDLSTAINKPVKCLELLLVEHGSAQNLVLVVVNM